MTKSETKTDYPTTVGTNSDATTSTAVTHINEEDKIYIHNRRSPRLEPTLSDDTVTKYLLSA